MTRAGSGDGLAWDGSPEDRPDRRRAAGSRSDDRAADRRPGVLIVVRHGESTANAAHVFTGRVDVGLTGSGARQAAEAAELIRAELPLPDVLITSPMRRALDTAEIIRSGLGLQAVPLRTSWRLAERDYGFLTGMAKSTARAMLGPERYITLRRTRHGMPSALEAVRRTVLDLYTDPASGLPPAGDGESLDDVIDRVRPCWAEVRELVRAGRVVMLVAHGNSLRALCTLIDDLSDEEVLALNIPPGQPLVYQGQDDGSLAPRGGRYLDPVDARAATAQIAREGGT